MPELKQLKQEQNETASAQNSDQSESEDLNYFHMLFDLVSLHNKI